MSAQVTTVEGVKALLREKPRGAAVLDPRTKLVLVVGTSTLCLVSGGEVTVLVLLLSAVLAVAAGGKPGIAVRFVAGYLALNVIIALTRYFQVPGLSSLVIVLGFTLLKFMPVFMLAAWFMITTRTGELIAAFERMHAPKSVTIPLAVMVRYLPTLGVEFGFIRDTMRMRGIDCSPANVVRRPLAMMEYVMVPLLMRCIKVADELAASATTRGIENECRRSCVRDVRMRLADAIALLLFAVFAVAVILLDQSAIGAAVVWGGAR